jgi:adenylylsulfate kinase
MAWAMWITGLPGSGKSTIVKELLKKLEAKGISAEVIRMDEIRKMLTPEPKYTAEEREVAYKKMADIGKEKVDLGKNVIFDATGHKRSFREYARQLVPEFYEVYVKCPPETAVERESLRKSDLVTQELYKKALRRLHGEEVELVGEVIGIDVEYEEPLNPDITVDSNLLSPEEAAEKIMVLFK